MAGQLAMRWAVGRPRVPGAQTAPDEDDLVLRARQGDGDAFTALVRLHQDRIYRLAWRMAGPDAADDLAQQAFIKAWQGLTRFDGGSTFGTWLFRIAINTCLDHLRGASRFRQAPLEDREWPSVDGDPADQVAAAAERADRRAALAWALDRLPAKDRLLLALRVGAERSYEEIGDLLSLNPRTVGTRLYRARARLQRLIMECHGGNGDDLR